MEEKVKELLKSVPHLVKVPYKRMWVDYDDGADVLYISFRKPQGATDSEMEGDIIYHYKGKQLVGVTILNAKRFRRNLRKPNP